MVEQLTQMSAKLADEKMKNAELRDEVNRLKHELRDADTRSSPNHTHVRQQSADATLTKRVNHVMSYHHHHFFPVYHTQYQSFGVVFVY
jgi:chromosome segregation ATPase